MKIHKKILTHYLSCTSPVDKEGYLYKKPQKKRTGTFQRRWFVLKANLLFYQERPADRHLLGVIVLEGCAVQRSEADEQFAFSLVFGPGLKTYRLAAGDHRSQESWVTALFSARHCHLSQLLRDLQRKYERSFSASAVLQAPSAPTKVLPKKSPKLWQRRNAYVTPLNGPAPLYGEWPLVGSDPLVEFSKLHEYYGQEVTKAREEWLRSRQTAEDSGDLIDLG
uniref:Sesquipedalian n=1 Tax=Kryptolebias marmoratus TaxID=37003 RepID=A0A3Q3A7T6_KRYMA